MKILVPLAAVIGLSTSPALSFDFSFDWKGLELCTSGKPNKVKNPTFKLKNVPEGTKFIRFKLVDLNVPSYNHGGGVAVYDGSGVIKPGAFKYKSPCPPDGAHVYEWRATAQSKKNGGKLATAKAKKSYP